jgi:hypothetical protein
LEANTVFQLDMVAGIRGQVKKDKKAVWLLSIWRPAERLQGVDSSKRFVRVDAPGRLGAEGECEIRPFFELEDFPGDPPRSAIENTEMRFRMERSQCNTF